MEGEAAVLASKRQKEKDSEKEKEKEKDKPSFLSNINLKKDTNKMTEKEKEKIGEKEKGLDSEKKNEEEEFDIDTAVQDDGTYNPYLQSNNSSKNEITLPPKFC